MGKFHFFWKSKLGQWSMDTFADEYRTYNCCEQYMMAQKAILFGDRQALKDIMEESAPRLQQKYGRQVKGFNQEIWDRKARIIVYNGNFLRFSQNARSKEYLMNTEGELVEASPYDDIWGIKLAEDDPRALDKSKWQGTNWLGEVLTKLREDFRNGTARLKSLEEEWE